MISKISILFSMIILLLSCDPADNRLKVINSSKDNIYAYFSCDSSMNDLDLFRTGYYKNAAGDNQYVETDNYVLKDSSINFSRRLGNSAWVDYVKSCQDESLYVFYFTDSILDNYSDNEIKSKKLYLDRESYSLNQLNDLNWTINYSGRD